MLFQKEISAVDIGTSSIKVIRMQKSWNKLKLLAAEKIHLREDILEDENGLAQLLRNIFTELNYKPKNVTTAVSSKNVIIRNIEFPAMSDKELTEALKLGAEEYLPFPVENSMFKYLVLNNDGKKMEIMLAAIKEMVIDNYVKLFRKAEIELEVINVQPMALLSLVHHQLEIKDPVLIFEIGASGSRIIIGDEKNIYLVRDLKYGGKSFTDLIEASYSFRPEKAEKYKKRLNLKKEIEKEMNFNPDDNFSGDANIKTFSSLINHFTEELNISLDFFHKKYSGLYLENIFFTGGGSQLQGLKSRITADLNTNLEIIDPLNNLPYDNKLDQEFSVALGLVASEVLDNEN
ncbi:MAG: type IV pilus assembly protein PilM [Halanaerobiaceae bacterium]